ncbi:MAG: thioredoxin family protein [Ignavibacteria bacterium]|nr:thioredoxin family protein [Ignavibacteria bacterium]
MVSVEIQFFRGCPTSSEMIQRVRKSIEGLDKVEYIETLVEDNDKAKAIGFRGSPTLLIDGEDFEGIPSPAEPSLSCRFYPKGLPTIQQIRERIIRQF